MITNHYSEQEVHALFSRVAHEYDLMNNIISLGIQNSWRRKFFMALAVQKNTRALDLCCGTGDLTISLARRTNFVVGLDFNQKMLNMAQSKIDRQKLRRRIKLINGDAMKPPFKNNVFNYVTIGFGLRNVPDAGQTIAEAYRVLKPGGKFAILEMSQPRNSVVRLGWRAYFKIFPHFARLSKNRVADYRYLAQTSEAFLSPAALKNLLLAHGFKTVKVRSLTLGAGAIHIAQK